MQERRGNVGKVEAQKQSFELQRAQFAEAQKLRQEEIDRHKKLLDIAIKDGADQEKIVQIKKKIFDLYGQQKQALAAQASELVKQNASKVYWLKDDKPTFERSRIVHRIGGEPGSERLSIQRLGPKLKGIGLYDSRDDAENFGSESARLVSDFEEDWRKKHGKLTKEEKAQAKLERKLNNRLQHAIEAVHPGHGHGDLYAKWLGRRGGSGLGGGTAKQRELVAYYKENLGKEGAGGDILVKIVHDGFNDVKKALYKMAGIQDQPSSKATSK